MFLNITQTVGIVVKNRMRESSRLIPRRKAIVSHRAPGFLLLFPGPRLIPDGEGGGAWGKGREAAWLVSWEFVSVLSSARRAS